MKAPLFSDPTYDMFESSERQNGSLKAMALTASRSRSRGLTTNSSSGSR
ncbi:MAG: hypothetical protein H5T32_04370 [Candidatus Methanosuratus sp.]|nr:hypothetical protein [Candidatus Methanosuratincola sp.]